MVFQLPASTAQQLKDGGLGYLETMPKNTQKGWHGKYTAWHPTPLLMNDGWGSTSYEGVKYWTSPGIGDYLNKYGFPISLEKKWEDTVNRALVTPGNYYAYGRTGLIIIMPEELRVIYAYSG